MSTKAPTKTPAELAALLLSGAMFTTLEPGNEDLMSFEADQSGPLEKALAALLRNEPSKAAELLHHAVKLCAEPVADGRAQAQRTRILSAAAGALALLEQADYRGPDRRSGEDRRSGTDRRATSASPAPAVLEQRCGEQRRAGADRRNPLRDALWNAAFNVETAQINLNTRLGALLAVLESTVRARRTVRLLDAAAVRDEAFRVKLSAIDPAYGGGIDDDSFDEHLGEVLLLARGLCADVSEELVKAATDAYAVNEAAGKGGTHG